MQNVEAESDQNIEIFRLNDLQSLRRKSVNELLAHRLNLDGFDVGQQGRTINKIERMVGGPRLFIEAKILIVQDVFPEIWICQSSRYFRKHRIPLIGGLL